MDKNNGDGVIFEGACYHLAGGNGATVYRSLKEVNGINNLVLAIEVNDLEHLFLEVAHGVVEVVKDLPG
ncbi:hypothetical protein ES703_116957 [subsurface metagenome]